MNGSETSATVSPWRTSRSTPRSTAAASACATTAPWTWTASPAGAGPIASWGSVSTGASATSATRCQPASECGISLKR